MAKQKEDPTYIEIGNTQFHVDALSKMTKTEFIKTYSGLLNVDVKDAAKQLSKHLKK